MPYPEYLIAPMRGEMTDMGARELSTAQAVDEVVTNSGGVVMLVVNSVCGCAAGKARPAVGMALQHATRPARVATVFAGGDEAAVAHLRSLLSDYPPSSPSMALFQDGKPVYMLHRTDIERREAPEIAGLLTQVFDHFCPAPKSA